MEQRGISETKDSQLAHSFCNPLLVWKGRLGPRGCLRSHKESGADLRLEPIFSGSRWQFGSMRGRNLLYAVMTGKLPDLDNGRVGCWEKLRGKKSVHALAKGTYKEFK